MISIVLVLYYFIFSIKVYNDCVICFLKEIGGFVIELIE